nr:sigma-70 family RNA polymerase sigma factor [Intestinimonas butyriciproducens]
MPCTEAYREHIMYTFNGYCKTVMRFAAINAWRDRSRRRQKEISLEYLTEEKFYHLGTTDEYFEAPYEEYPITICGQTVILTNGELAAALLSLPDRNREIIFLYFSGIIHSRKSGKCTDVAGVRPGI